ncbi:MAG: riboflavin synthase [Planctomycetota bacterium]
MFTGIVAQKHRVRAVRRSATGVRLQLERLPLMVCDESHEPWDDFAIGESIAVNGVCLTLVEDGADLAFDVIPETLRRSSLEALRAGHSVNLERALRVGDRLGGHYVLGHVDATGQVAALDKRGQETLLTIEVTDRGDPTAPFDVIDKGSVAIDGVSLTVASCAGDRFTVALIPHTLAVTTLGDRKRGDRVNLEMDHLAKWVRKLTGM